MGSTLAIDALKGKQHLQLLAFRIAFLHSACYPHWIPQDSFGLFFWFGIRITPTRLQVFFGRNCAISEKIGHPQKTLVFFFPHENCQLLGKANMPPSNMDFRQSGKLATCSFLGFLLRFLFWKTKISMENNQKSSLVLETTYQVFEIQLNLHVFFLQKKTETFGHISWLHKMCCLDLVNVS